MIYILPTDTCYGMACAFDDVKNYHKIYGLKKRDLSKPLSIMVESFDWLLDYSDLNFEQVEFLKTYKKPFTILTWCDYLQMILNLDQEDFEYENKDVYEKIALRVAHNDIQKKLIWEIWPIFLTSANISTQKEIYTLDEVMKEFWGQKWVKILFDEEEKDLKEVPPSDIFEFIWESLEINYLRK